MSGSAAYRKRVQRAREMAGRRIVPVTIDEVDVITFLIDTRLLEPCAADDRAAISSALSRFIQITIEANDEESSHA
jgi:hypothetical protein